MTPYEVAFMANVNPGSPDAKAVKGITIVVVRWRPSRRGVLCPATSRFPPAALTPRALQEIVFFSDIILHFFTGFFDPATQEEVLSQRVIVKHYLRRRFIVDFLTCMPWDAMFGNDASTLRLLRMLWLWKFVKLLRALRVNALFQRVTVRWGVSTMTVSVTKYAVVVLLLTHWAACALQLVAVLEKGA